MMYLWASCEVKNFFIASLKSMKTGVRLELDTDPDSEPDPDPLVRGTDPGIRSGSLPKYHGSPNTDRFESTLSV
jgi:hypothetical protein